MRTFRALLLASLATTAMAASPLAAQTSAERLSFYGFINQGYGVSNAQPILGLNKDASGDYRAAALQARYAITGSDNFVVQAGSRALGTSPYSTASGTIALDWAFYHHRFDHASVRVGRLPVPFGYLSETREVGTLLPMYRAPAGYYLESFRSMDGGMATTEVGPLEATAFAGGTNGTFLTWAPTSVVPAGVVVSRLRLERMVGGDLRYHTPIEGLQIRGGLATLRSLDTVKVQTAPATRFVVLSGGLLGEWDRFYTRGEARRIKIGSNSRQYSFYNQMGARVTSRVWVNAQGDFTNNEAYTAAVNEYRGRWNADRSLGLSYQFAPNIVTKLEQHFVRGGIDGYVAPTAETPYTNYSIASLAVSF